MSWSLEEAKAAWAVEQDKRRTRAARALAQGRSARTVIKHVGDYLSAFNSEERLPPFLDLAAHMPPDIFWRVLAREWSGCDDTWDLIEPLLALMRRNMDSAPARKLGAADDVLEVFRGCSQSRVHGISWSLDWEVALGFAFGHRGIPVPNPVVADARIKRSSVFMLVHDRDEYEVLLDPAGLIDLTVEDWSPWIRNHGSAD